MAERLTEVYVRLDGRDVRAGRLWSHRGRGSESMTFAYDEAYLTGRDAYALDPAQLGLHAGHQQTPQGRAIFGAFSDAAPDTWGRRIIDRRETHAARAEGRARRSFGEIDYLLGVRDDVREGAVRFRDTATEEFLAPETTGVPVLTSLPELLAAAAKMERGEETDEDLALLTRAGSSLGGARPKAHVVDANGRLAIAKFPSPKDVDRDVTRWEAVALRLAAEAGISAPRNATYEINGRWALIVERFDRAGGERIGYISAMTMLGLHDGQRASYLDLADAIATHSPQAGEDLRELWRRMAFTILVSNYDDHLRNHGFLRTTSAGWTLAPAFDINPDPSGKRELHTAVDYDDYTASIGLLLRVAEYFRLDAGRARQTLREVTSAVAGWREVAAAAGLEAEIDRMEPAFEHVAAEEARDAVRT